MEFYYKEIFQDLKYKYKEELRVYQTEKTELLLGIKMWISDMIIEKDKIVKDIKLNKGRLSSKEISKKEFKMKDEAFQLKLKDIESKIKTLKELSK